MRLPVPIGYSLAVVRPTDVDIDVWHAFQFIQVVLWLIGVALTWWIYYPIYKEMKKIIKDRKK